MVRQCALKLNNLFQSNGIAQNVTAREAGMTIALKRELVHLVLTKKLKDYLNGKAMDT